MNSIDIVLPVHNEGKSIARTLREFYQQVSENDRIGIRFIVCEDGSSDDSVQVLEKLGKELPMVLLSEGRRKGYSQAVVDGFRATNSTLVGFIDSDGQCAPADFARLVSNLSEGIDLVIGYRNPRIDHWSRLVMSKAFHAVFRSIFKVRLKDPSCPYLLVKKPLLQKILNGNIPILSMGFWWEFVARASACGAVIKEVPVSHRSRTDGGTRVYKTRKIPWIALSHLFGLFKLKKSIFNKN
jgi:dolichol-phosphate mannosyltransferase